MIPSRSLHRLAPFIDHPSAGRMKPGYHLSHCPNCRSPLSLRVSGFSDLAVLITGESGTEKELMARAIHRLDPKRRTGPFVPINCGALGPGLVESELFGHSRGAFTGADRDRKGLVRAADGGILFLDEIGELGSDVQVKLLRVLQDRRVMMVGTDHDVGVDLRVIAATNRNLELMMQQGQFREDLFHRLNIGNSHHEGISASS